MNRIHSWFIHSRSPAAPTVSQAPHEEYKRGPCPLTILGADRATGNQQKSHEGGFIQGRRLGAGREVRQTRHPGAATSPAFTAPPHSSSPLLSKEVTKPATSAPSAGSAAPASPRSRARAARPPAPRPPARRPRLTAPPLGSPRPRRSREQGRGRGHHARARAGGARRVGCTARVQPRWKGVRTERAKPGAPSTPTPWSGSRTPSCASCPG